MARWARENLYNAEISASSARHGVPAPLIKAIIAKESGFTAAAYRAEPNIKDASRGLMQILHSTAKLVRPGVTVDQLMDPATNIDIGAQLLAGLLKQTKGDVPAAISAYNGGMRPHLALGARATKLTKICTARDTKTGDCIRFYTAQPGEFGNQPYVSGVLDALTYFGGITGRATVPDPVKKPEPARDRAPIAAPDRPRPVSTNTTPPSWIEQLIAAVLSIFRR